MKRVLVASALLHLAVFGALARSRPAAPVSVPAPALEEMTVEMEPEAVTPAPVLAPTFDSSEPMAAVSTPAHPSSGVASAPMSVSSAAPASSAGVEPVAGANTDWVVNLGAGVEGSRLPGPPRGANPFITRPPGDGSGARDPNARRKDDTLKGALLAADAAKGLGPDGPVLRALEDETRSSLAPLRGNATFRAIVDATGTVTALHILDQNGGPGWDDARDRAFAALQKKKLDLHGTSGAMIDIRVESELRLPSGQTSHGDVGVQDGRLTLTGDLSDIGSRPTRAVKARLSSYTPL